MMKERRRRSRTKSVDEREEERRKRHFTFGLSSLIEPECIYQILHVDLNPSEILETARVRRMGRSSCCVCDSV